MEKKEKEDKYQREGNVSLFLSPPTPHLPASVQTNWPVLVLSWAVKLGKRSFQENTQIHWSPRQG